MKVSVTKAITERVLPLRFQKRFMQRLLVVVFTIRLVDDRHLKDLTFAYTASRLKKEEKEETISTKFSKSNIVTSIEWTYDNDLVQVTLVLGVKDKA